MARSALVKSLRLPLGRAGLDRRALGRGLRCIALGYVALACLALAPPAAADESRKPAATLDAAKPTGATTGAAAQAAPPQGSSTAESAWNEPFEPFRVLGNVYYVGALGVSAYFIQTPAGAILLDGGLQETAPLIEKNIATLGFRLKDVKVLLNSHAHFDHAGGLAALQKASGGKLVASQGDAPVLRAGSSRQPPVRVDRVIADGDTVELGGTVLTAHVTPGHTQGCTTWTTTVVEAGRRHPVVFHCSTSVVDQLLNNPRYPSIVADYERSFAALRALPCDVFLAPHGDFFQLTAKRAKMTSGAPNPFIDPSELGRFVDRSEQAFREALAKERAQLAPAAPPPRT
jgi:metallo-beta-lactamase class B